MLKFCRWLTPSKTPKTRSTIRLSLQSLEARDVPATFTVTTIADAGVGSFRQALLDANSTVGTDTINFVIPATGTNTINVLSALPVITETVLIDGRTESDFAGVPLVVLNGASAGAAVNGLVVRGDAANGSTIRGLVIDGFTASGILVLSDNTTITGNYIGTNATGSATVANGLNGILVQGGSANNLIGGTTALDRNILSGNGNHGIMLQGIENINNRVQGNYIGLAADGVTKLGNTFDGIVLMSGASTNTIGGTAAGSGNLISGNGRFGITLLGGTTQSNAIQGNVIGLNSAEAIVGNVGDGIYAAGGTSSNTIGGTGTARNIISGNGLHGIELTSNTTTLNVITNNRIGTDSTGLLARANTFDGIVISGGASINDIGASGLGNLISGNGRHGISLVSASTFSTLIVSNSIGLNAAGTTALANAGDGIFIAGGTNTTIGGSSPAEGNTISGNGIHGIEANGSGVNGLAITANKIGLNVAGTAAVANVFDGVVVINGAANVNIGDTTPASGNIISGNGRYGVTLLASGANVTVSSNTIGLNSTGTAAVSNLDGVYLGSANRVTIGSGNVISGNRANGITLNGSAQTQIRGNFIGTGAGGTGSFANVGNGIFVGSGTTLTTIGGTGTGFSNTIANNGLAGVLIGTGSAGGNAIIANSIVNNGGLGIDFNPVFPIAAISLDTAVVVANQLQVTGTVTNGVPNINYRVEVFASPAGSDEGQNFLGFIDIATDATGLQTYSGSVPYTVAQGTSITVTLVNRTSNNSTRFSNARSVVG